MFADGTLTTTYSGPITATGETYRRARGDARALGNLLGESRAYQQQGRGIGAGSKMLRYRAGIESDKASQDAFSKAQAAMAEQAMDEGNANLQFQSGRADEANRLRALMLDRSRVDQSFDLTKRGDEYDNDLFRRRLKAERYAQSKQRQGGFFSSLLDIF
jgi:hypothetical protein